MLIQSESGMIQERTIFVDGTQYSIVISDEREALLAAQAAGRVSVGLLWEGGEQEFPGILYLMEVPSKAGEKKPDLTVIDESYLQQAVRRFLGLPWVVAETERLVIREFMVDDIPNLLRETESMKTEEEREADSIFHSPEKLEAYIRSQYGFWGYGIWALVKKEDGVLVGKAGVSAGVNDDVLELSYHIFAPYRRQGYAEEACRAILSYVKTEYGCRVCAAAAPDNLPSINLLKKLGLW